MRYLSGIQPSGDFHIGNYFGMMKRMIELQNDYELFAFIVDFHALTSVTDPTKLRLGTQNAILDWLALGLNPDQAIFWIQSDVPEVTELAWILSCVTPHGLLERAHSYKDKVSKGLIANLGLFTYPVLMAADILIYQANKVPVGKDQKQHVEMARDIAIKFNNHYGETFIIPEAEINEDVAVVPGIDGQKMSKSYNNYIEIFAPENIIKKKVMSIVTDSKEIEESKDSNKCNVFALYKLFAQESEITELNQRYIQGGIGYGEAKKMLLEKILNYFAPYQNKRIELAKNTDKLNKIMQKGAEKARDIATPTLELVKKRIGLR